MMEGENLQYWFISLGRWRRAVDTALSFFYAVTKTKDFWKAEAVRSRFISS